MTNKQSQNNIIEPDAQKLAELVAEKMWEKDNAARAVNISVDANSPGGSTLRMPVRTDMLNGHNICHGGYIFLLADTAFAYACNSYNKVTVAAACDISFVNPAQLNDVLCATASEQYHAGRNGVYDVLITDQNNQTIALFRGKSRTISKTGPLDA